MNKRAEKVEPAAPKGRRLVGLSQEEIDELFLSAWDRGDLARATDFLKEGANPEAGASHSGCLARAAREPLFALELLKAGARVEKGPSERGGVLHWVCSTSFDRASERKAQARLVKALVKAGAPLNGTDEIGSTALMRAAGCGAIEAALALMELGSPLEARNRYGWSAYLCAVESGDEATCEALIKAGADWRAKNLKGEGGVEIALEEGPEFADQIARLHAREEARLEAAALEQVALPSASGKPRSKGL